MNPIVRACGIAAAAFALAATATYADPSIAGETAAGPVAATYLDHASAVIDGSDAATPLAGPGTAGPDENYTEVAQHSLASAATGMVRALNAVLPGSQALPELVDAYADVDTPDGEQECLARAVYFEARGEPLEGQLAVADVVLNRAHSGRYPTTICEVVTQRAQFSFIQNGRFPRADKSSDAWRKAVAIAEIARGNLAEAVAPNVLWYHADYVAPVWGRRLNRVTKIGAHIFYS